jgi:hypothetical protein
MTNEESKKPEILPETQLKLLQSVWGPIEAEVIKSLLESHGIACILKGLVVQSVHAFSLDGLGEIKIYVAERDYDTAKNLIESR